MVLVDRHCKIIVSCTYEDGNPVLMEDLKFLRQLIEDDTQFLEITALGKELAWNVVKLWMRSEGRNLTNFQVRFFTSSGCAAKAGILLTSR
jgi:hypothetical protein